MMLADCPHRPLEKLKNLRPLNHTGHLDTYLLCPQHEQGLLLRKVSLLLDLLSQLFHLQILECSNLFLVEKETCVVSANLSRLLGVVLRGHPAFYNFLLIGAREVAAVTLVPIPRTFVTELPHACTHDIVAAHNFLYRQMAVGTRLGILLDPQLTVLLPFGQREPFRCFLTRARFVGLHRALEAEDGFATDAGDSSDLAAGVFEAVVTLGTWTEGQRLGVEDVLNRDTLHISVFVQQHTQDHTVEHVRLTSLCETSEAKSPPSPDTVGQVLPPASETYRVPTDVLQQLLLFVANRALSPCVEYVLLPYVFLFLQMMVVVGIHEAVLLFEDFSVPLVLVEQKQHKVFVQKGELHDVPADVLDRVEYGVDGQEPLLRLQHVLLSVAVVRAHSHQ